MNYYFSAPECIYKPVKEWLLDEFTGLHYLMSFANSTSKWKDFYNDGANTLMIDSGAFSAWNSGKTIDFDSYLKFCKKLPEDVYKINLDVIPKTGSSQSDKEKCLVESFENFRKLNKEVKNVLPVHHYGEPIEWARRMYEETDYICISPANDTHENIKREYFKWFFSHMGTSVKTHVLGYSSMTGCKMFPFTSTDSISHKTTHMNGRILYRRTDGKTVGLTIDDYAKKFGHVYNPSLGLSVQPQLLTEATKVTVKSLIDYYNEIKEEHKTKDFSYLNSQLSMF